MYVGLSLSLYSSVLSLLREIFLEAYFTVERAGAVWVAVASRRTRQPTAARADAAAHRGGDS